MIESSEWIESNLFMGKRITRLIGYHKTGVGVKASFLQLVLSNHGSLSMPGPRGKAFARCQADASSTFLDFLASRAMS